MSNLLGDWTPPQKAEEGVPEGIKDPNAPQQQPPTQQAAQGAVPTSFPQTMGGGYSPESQQRLQQGMQQTKDNATIQRMEARQRPYTTQGVPDMLRAEPTTHNTLIEHPKFQELALKVYNYAKANDNKVVPMVPESTDPREIAEWAVTNYSWLEWSDTRKMMDYNKLKNMPIDVLQAFVEGANMWRNTDATREGAMRAVAGIMTSPLTFMGVGTIAGAAKGFANKAGFKYFEKLAEKATLAQKFNLKRAMAVGAVEGAAFGAADSAYWEKFESKAEGRDFDKTRVAVSGAIGAVAAPTILAGGYGAYKGSKQAINHGLRLYRGSQLGAIRTVTGRGGTWTDSQAAAANFAEGEDGKVHVADAYPRNPMIFNQKDYSPQELIEKLELSPEDGARLIDSVDNQKRIPAAQAINMLEDVMRERGIDMAVVREPAQGLDSLYGLEKGSLEQGDIQSFKVLDPSILRAPADMREPMYVLRNQRGMVGTYYHGSPHEHEKFKEEFLRSGEGAAVYGEGFYVAQRKSTAQWYADNLSRRVNEASLGATTLDDKPIDILSDAKRAAMSEEELADYRAAVTVHGIRYMYRTPQDMSLLNKDEVLRALHKKIEEHTGIRDRAKEMGAGAAGEVKRAQEAIDELTRAEELVTSGRIKVPESKAKPNLYRVQVHPRDDEFLDWDKTIDEQSDTVKQGLARLGIREHTDAGDYLPNVQELFRNMNKYITALRNYDHLSNGRVIATNPHDGDLTGNKLADMMQEWLETQRHIAADSSPRMMALAVQEGLHLIKSANRRLQGVQALSAKHDLPEAELVAIQNIKMLSGRLEARHRGTQYSLLNIAESGNRKGAEIYNMLRRTHGAERIRDVLHNVGIKGNRYLDGGSRRQGKGTHNLVIFKEEDIDIRQRGDKFFEGHDPHGAVAYLKDMGISEKPTEEFGFKEMHDYVDLAREHGYKGVPYDPPWKFENSRVSTRFPTAVKGSPKNPHEEELHAGLEAMKEVPTSFQRNMAKVAQYPNFNSKARLPEKRAEEFIEHVKDNLLHLYNLVPEDIRERSKRWYDGANKMAVDYSIQYDMPDHAVAGIMAVLSPQKDWYQNVSLAERVLDIMTKHQQTDWDDGMLELGKKIFLDKVDQSTKKGRDTYTTNANILASIRGKRLGEILEPVEQAMWLRLYDELWGDPSYRVVTPEGGFGAVSKNDSGELSRRGWGSLSEISKAVSIYKNPTLNNVSRTLGEQHKVRNFYNNIIDPSDAMSVTIDTHAVAAGLLRPLSGKSREVLHNFGGGIKGEGGASSSSVSGSVGTYGLYAEAYRRAAAEVGLLPREMQSITWEAVRGLFPSTYKQVDANVDIINGMWDNFRKGKLSIDEVRSQLYEHANGIEPPSWYRSGTGLHEAEGDQGIAGNMAESELSGAGLGRSQRGAAGGSSGGDPTKGINPIVVLGGTGAAGAASLPFVPYSEGERE